MKKKVEKKDLITALYCRLSVDDIQRDDGMDSGRIREELESNSITHQELICKGWFQPPNTYDCGSFVVNGKAVIGKEQKNAV